MTISELIAQLRAAGATIEVIEIAVRSLEAAMEAERTKEADRKAKQAARVRKHRDTRKGGITVTLPSRDGNSPPGPSPDGPPPSPAPQPPPLNPSPDPGSDPDGSAGDAGQAGGAGEQARAFRHELLTRGVELIVANTGRSHRSARALIGHWLGIARDEAAVVLEVIEDADGRELADFSTWVEFRLRKRREGSDRPPVQGRPQGRPPSGLAGRLIRLHAESLQGAYDVEPPSIDANDPGAEPGRGEPSRGQDRGVSWASGGASRPSDALLRAAGEGGHDSRASSALRRRRAAGG